ncbi:hypothetical protein ACFYV5_33650 [Streptomyces sp. NPDC003035]|uniref:SCO2400 family protein n=1 Tax=Streptomyces sp. NPDC003035 TaxID=3364676 RepID=UPI0036B98EB9
MDYCHQCRRHLNGALACAGCGTPVEELRYETPQPAPRAVAAERVAYVEPGERGEPGGRAEREEPPAEHVYELDPLEPPRTAAPGGRAARRVAASGRSGTRRNRRARSRKGRNVLVGTLGLVLAAGTLSMAKLALAPPGEGGAATAVQEEEVVETSLPPLPTESATPPDGGPTPVEVTTSASPKGSDAPAPGHTGIPGEGSGGSGSGGSDSGGSGSGDSQGSGDGAPGGSPSDSPSASPPADEPGPSGSPSQPGTTPSGTPSGGAPTTATPSPTPSPTRDCWFIFFCR